MGIVCGFYRVNKETIEQLKSQPEQAQNYIDDNYTSVSGKYHLEQDITFETDKAWDIAMFLLKKCDPTTDKELKHLVGIPINPDDGWGSPRYINPQNVQIIHDILQTITLEQLAEANDQEEMIQNNVYAADWWDEPDWEYFNSHIDSIKKAFSKAAVHNDGIVINFH